MPTHALIETPQSIEIKKREPSSRKPLPRVRVLRVAVWGIVGGVLAGIAIWLLPAMIQTPPSHLIQASVLLSGAWNPPEAMSAWMQWLSVVSPLSYFIDFGTASFLRETDWT